MRETREMAVDPFLQMYDAGELKVAAEFLTNWLPFLTGDVCDCCSATLRCRIGSLCPGSAPPAISSSDPTCASPRGFVVTGWDADPSPVPTGWDIEPERSAGYDKTPPSSERVDLTGWGTESERTLVPTGWESGSVQTPAPTWWDSDTVQTPAPVPTGWDSGSERTLAPTGWDSGLETTPEPTGWFTEMAVVLTGRDVEPEIPIGPSAPAQGGEKMRMSWADMVQEEEEEARRSERTPAPTGWDSRLEKTPEPTGWFTEMAVVPTGWDVEPETPIGPLAPAQGGEKLRMSWADMAQEEDELEEEEEARRSERMPAPTGWDSGLEKTPEPTGWFTEMTVVPTCRYVEPEIPIGLSAPLQGGEKVSMSWADMAQEEDELEEEEEARRSVRILAPTGWDSRLEKTPEPTGWFAEMAVVPTGWDVEPEILIGPSAPAQGDEKVRMSWVDMAQEEEEEEEARRSERAPAPTGWDSGLEKTPEPSGWFTEMAVVPTGRYVEPEIPIGLSAPLQGGEKVRMSWAYMAQEEDELEEEEEARWSERTLAPTGWDSRLEKTSEPTGWFTEMTVVPTGRDVEPEIPIGLSALAQRGEKVRMSWADMAQEEDELEEEEEARRSERTPAPTGRDSGLEKTPEPTGWFTDMAVVPTGRDVEPEIPVGPSAPAQGGEKVRMSWADMAQEEDELEEEEEARRSESSVEKKKPELSRDQREQIRFGNVQRKKDFICLERIKGKVVNVLQGLELHTGVFSAAEQNRIVDFVYELQKKGQNRELGEHTYSKPKKWMRGKGRETIQFGCAYNYAKKNGNLPGILRNVNADPLPHLFKEMIRRLVRWHVLPASCVPDSCIVNIYEPEDCIPPHVDSHDFVRPFCTVSFLSECNILFGSELKIAGPGEFTGPFSIPLPVGSVLVLNGNSSDVAKHCVPAVPTKRISITFRRMDERKRPTDFVPELDLLSILPLPYEIDGVESNDHTGSAGSQSEQQMNGSIKGEEVLRGKSVYKFHRGHSSALGTSSHQDGDSEMSMSRGGNSVGRWFEPKTDRGLLGAPPYRADAYTSRQWLQEEGSASWIGRSQQSGGFRMIAGEEESACAPEVGELFINMRYGGELSRRQSSVKVQ